MPLILREDINQALTWAQLDGNFTYLQGLIATSSTPGPTGATGSDGPQGPTGPQGGLISGDPNTVVYFDDNGNPTSNNKFHYDSNNIAISSGIGDSGNVFLQIGTYSPIDFPLEGVFSIQLAPDASELGIAIGGIGNVTEFIGGTVSAFMAYVSKDDNGGAIIQCTADGEEKDGTASQLIVGNQYLNNLGDTIGQFIKMNPDTKLEISYGLLDAGPGTHTKLILNDDGFNIETFNSTYLWPNADGLNNQVLSTDGSGNLFFATSSSFNLPSGTPFQVLQLDINDEPEFTRLLSTSTGSRSIDIENRTLTYNNQNVINWFEQAMRDDSGVISFDWKLRNIHDTSGQIVVKSNNTTLVDQNGINSFDWSSRIAFDSNTEVAVDYQNRILKNGSTASVDWVNRRLLRYDGGIILDWSGLGGNDLEPTLRLYNVPSFNDDSDASLGGLTAGNVYKTTTGGSTYLKIVP